MARLPVNVRMRNGFRARCRLDEFSAFVEIWIYREYEVQDLRWNDARTVADVGANVGAASLGFASRAPKARILAVEPAPAVIPSLIRNVALNRLSDRVDVMPVALGATAGIGYLRPSTSSVSASVGADPTRGGLPVPVMSLGQLLDETGLDEVDVLKLDCEGAEFEVLLSSDNNVLRRNRIIVGEYHASNPADVTALMGHLETAGFRTSSLAESLPGHHRDKPGRGLFQAVRG